MVPFTVTLSNLASKWHEASRGLSATAEFLVTSGANLDPRPLRRDMITEQLIICSERLMTVNCNRFHHTNPPYGGGCTLLGTTAPRLTFLESLVELMLSSNWHVTLRLTVFEIFAVKWLRFKPKILDFGYTPGAPPQKGRRPARDRYVPSCQISRRLVPRSPRYL